MINSVDIKRGDIKVFTIPVDSTFVHRHTFMGEHSVTCTLRAVDAAKFKVGDYFNYQGEKYSLYEEPDFSRSEGVYAYTVTFYASYYKLFHVLIKDEGATDFPYFGNAEDHLNLLLANMQVVDAGFQIGAVGDSEAKLIDYEQLHCYDALVKIAETFGMEWEVIGKTISLKNRVGQDTSYIFEYGKGKGLYSLTRQKLADTSIVTRLYGYGSTQNIPASLIKQTSSEKLVFEGRYLDKNTSLFGLREGVAEFDEIYPRLKDKKVLSVTIPENIETAKTWTLRLDIPFDLAGEIIKDREPQVNFISGELCGESFKIAENTWNNETKELKIIVTDDNGYYLPNETRQPKVGDLFNLTEVNMPEAYITEAQEELKAATEEKLNQLCVPQYSHSLEIDPLFSKKKSLNINAGDKITIREAANDILIRVQQVSYPLNAPNRISLTLSDERLYTYEQKIRGEIIEVSNNADINAHEQARKYSSRAYRDAEETINLLGTALREEMALIGNPDDVFVLAGVFFTANKDNDPKSFYATAGQLQHDKYKDNAWHGRWVFESDFTAILADNNSPYILYARCSKTQNTAIFIVSTEQIGTEDVNGYYHFRIGVISSVYNDARSLTQTYGFTFIAGGSIKTGIIASVNGSTYFDLDAGEIGGKIRFSNASTTESGETIIDGGYFNSSLIKADAVIANAAKIANFAIQENQLVGNGEKIIFSNEALPPLEELIGGAGEESSTYAPGAEATATASETAAMSDGTINLDLEVRTQDMALPYAGVLSLKALNKAAITNLEQGGMLSVDNHTATLILYKVETGGTLTEKARRDISAASTDEAVDYTFYIPEAGSYRLEATATHRMQSTWAQRPEGTPADIYPTYTLDAALEILGATTDNKIRFSGSQEATQIGTDGFYSFWSLLNYLYFSQSQGLKVKGNCIISSPNGENTLTIDDNGISLSVPAGADASEYTAVFTQAGARANIESGEKLKALFGKIKKWFADMKTVAFTGAYSDLTGTPTIPSVPTKVSAFTNDAGYITKAVSDLENYYKKSETYTQTEITTLIQQARSATFRIVQTLPSTGEANVIYLLPKSGTAGDVYDEYLWLSGAWEKIGTTEIDLSDYYTKSQSDGKYINKTGDASNATAAFVEATADAEITSGSTLSVLFGQIKRTFTSLWAALSGKLGKTEKAASAAISDTVVDGAITTSKIADHAITTPKLSSDLTLPGTPQVGTPGALNSPSQTIATLGNLNEAMNAQQIGGTNIYRDTLGTSDFYLSATGEMKYRRFLDITPEAKRNLRGQSITVSFDYILENAVIGRGDTGFGFFVKYTDGTTTYVNAFIPAETTAVTKSGRFSATAKVEDKEIDNITSFQPFMYAQTTSGTATVGRPKFEIGTKATQWSPAPEEIARKSDLPTYTLDVTAPGIFKDGDFWIVPQA